MSRPSTIWLAFVACALLLAGALAVVSRHAIGLERGRVEAEAEADAGQRVRLALWRMDSEATAILVRENNRQPADFLIPDPPADAPPGARLYFEINHKGELLAPARTDVSGTATDRRAELRRLLHLMDAPAVRMEQAAVWSHQDGQAMALSQAIQQKDMQQVQNADLAIAAANVGNAAPPEAAAPMPKEQVDFLAKDAPSGGIAPAMPAPKPAAIAKSAAKESVQSKLDANELNQRAKAVQKSTNRYNSLQEEPSKVARPAEAAAPRPASAPAAAPALTARGSTASRSPAAKDAAADKARAAVERDAAVADVFATPQEEQAAPRLTEDSRVTSLQPVWIDGELLLVRAVGDGARQRVQGIWIDHKALGSSLLDAIRDLLPSATLAPYEPFVFTRDNLVRTGVTAGLAANRLTAIPRSLEDVPMAMVSMPWVLVPGMAPALAAASGSALQILLGSAWAGALLAIAAAAFLLRGVLVLSERRAAFVSSVTHELRTPLTTFTLYSEMLADGMVKDPEKQRGYLQTLRTEAGRLSHLVENVLAYSRIERGSARTRIEAMNVQTLADRLMPRLSERAASVGAAIDITMPSDLAGRTLATDASAVEQIIFNLVDNAAKYAPPAAGGPPWQLIFASDGGTLQVDLRDHGPGIAPSERKRLFRPFHKSAQDAANSKPGVGLGLALSRQLAKALGGSLVLAESGPSGTTFRLVLPMDRTFGPR